MTAAPAGQVKAAEENAPAPVETAAPTPTAPNEPIEQGVTEVVRKAETKKEQAVADPAGKVAVRRKATKTTRVKNDPLDHVDLEKLPIAVGIGQVTGEVQEYAGRAVASLSLKGWVGDAPFKVLASDLHEIEEVVAELRKQLS